MKHIRFDFTCARAVPFYAHLCNQYLHVDALEITIGCDGSEPFGTQRYFIEAKGEQAELEQLADAIAADFLLSAWLIDSRIQVIHSPAGSKALLETPLANSAGVPFCQQCYPHFGDNQAAKFGELTLACPCCHGEALLTPAQQALTLSDLKAMAAQLLSQGELTVEAEGISLSLNAFPQGEHYQRPQLLICDPNSLNAHFNLKERQILALSSIEKPLICAAPIANHPKLHGPLYDIGFAYSRVVVVLAELLRQKGVNWLYLNGVHPRPKLAWVANAWA
ncbi:MAG: NiFe hydrogenase, partial [Shewanella sp.]